MSSAYTLTSLIIMNNKGRLPTLGMDATRPEPYARTGTSDLSKHFNRSAHSTALQDLLLTIPRPIGRQISERPNFLRVLGTSNTSGCKRKGKLFGAFQSASDFVTQLLEIAPNRGFYELIRKHHPCKAYFDLKARGRCSQKF